jgi:hypothetical protein
MSEPIHLIKGDELLTVYAPSFAAQLMTDGWQRVDVPLVAQPPLPEPAPHKFVQPPKVTPRKGRK